MEAEQEKELWRLAKKRVNFKRHLAIYLVINTLFWCIWWFDKEHKESGEYPWPIWPMLGWGIGLAFEYVGAYVSNKPGAVQKEFEKLKKERE